MYAKQGPKDRVETSENNFFAPPRQDILRIYSVRTIPLF